MRYYLLSDINGYYDEMIEALSKASYFLDQEPHKTIICGDLFDREKKAKEVQYFVTDLIKKDEIILIRGKHEDLMVSMLDF